MRCKNQNCKTKLNKYNTFRVQGYADNEIATNDFTKIHRPVKIFICQDCAKMYFGKFYKEDECFSTSLTEEMEFKEEFCSDIFQKIR